VHLMHQLRTHGFKLFDIQQLTAHTESLGACEIPRKDYLARLTEVVALSTSLGSEIAPLPVTKEEVEGRGPASGNRPESLLPLCDTIDESISIVIALPYTHES